MSLLGHLMHKLTDQEVYLSLAMEPADRHLYSIVKNVLCNNRSANHIGSSSSVSTMIPTPGMSNSVNSSTGISVRPENHKFSTSNSVVEPKTIACIGSLPSITHGPTDTENNASLTASNGNFFM